LEKKYLLAGVIIPAAGQANACPVFAQKQGLRGFAQTLLRYGNQPTWL
jgi:hypothetical protein